MIKCNLVQLLYFKTNNDTFLFYLKIGNYMPFSSHKIETKFPSHSESKVNLKSLSANHSCVDHPYYVLLPIICASNVDPYDIFIYSLMSKYMKK